MPKIFCSSYLASSVSHYDHKPKSVPRERTQKYWQSKLKELVPFYTIRESSTNYGDENDNNDTYTPYAQSRSPPVEE